MANYDDYVTSRGPNLPVILTRIYHDSRLDEDGKPYTPSIDAEIARWGPGWRNAVTSYRKRQPGETDPDEDQDFRNAWRDDGTTVHVDMPAARLIQEGRIQARGRRVDAPTRAQLDAAQTPAELRAVEGAP